MRGIHERAFSKELSYGSFFTYTGLFWYIHMKKEKYEVNPQTSLRCNTVQHSAMCCNTLLHNTTSSCLWEGQNGHFLKLYIYTCTDTAQHTATHCNALQPTSTHVTLCITTDLLLRGQLAGYFRISTFTHTYTLQHTATHFNTLQRTCGEDKVDVSEFWQKGRRTHTATHCNTLQRTCGEGKLDISEFWKRGWHLILWGEGEG